jgi:GntR family transcriptional regulator / MocR family aminotransferase
MASGPSLQQRAPALLGLELATDPDGSVWRGIFVALRNRILGGDLLAGTRLPSTRQLASQLSISRSHVADAYEALAEEGLVTGRGRHGTYISERTGRVTAASSTHSVVPALLSRISRPLRPEALASMLDWRPGQAPSGLLPLAAWRRACREAGRHLPPMDWGDPRGEPGLRQAISAFLREERSIDVHADRIILTRGGAHAMDLVSQTFLRPGDRCAIEDPGHPSVARTLTRAGAELQLVPVDDEGLSVDSLVSIDRPPALVHVTPGHQYPTGGRLSAQRRHALVAMARRHGFLIVENEYDFEYDFEGSSYPPIAAGAPECTVLIGTFAKGVSPSLRLGFLIAPHDAADALAASVAHHRMQASWPGQRIMQALLESGDLVRHLRRAKTQYAQYRRIIRDRLKPFSRHVSLLGDSGGLHLVIRGNTSQIDQDLQQQLRHRNVVFDAVADYARTEPRAGGILLSYGHMNAEAWLGALAVLCDCIRAAVPELHWLGEAGDRRSSGPP